MNVEQVVAGSSEKAFKAYNLPIIAKVNKKDLFA